MSEYNEAVPDKAQAEEDQLVLITNDSRMKDGQLTDGDRAVLKPGMKIMSMEEALQAAERGEFADAGPAKPLQVSARVAKEFGHPEIKGQELTDDLIETLGQAGMKVKTGFDIETLMMTEDEAQFVRLLRVNEGWTYRGVAQETAKAWKTGWGDNQAAGVALCERAAAILGEDWMVDPWN